MNKGDSHGKRERERKRKGVVVRGSIRGMVYETSKRVGEDGRGHYGNRGWASGLRDGEMVWVMFRVPWNGFLSLCYQMGLVSAKRSPVFFPPFPSAFSLLSFHLFQCFFFRNRYIKPGNNFELFMKIVIFHSNLLI